MIDENRTVYVRADSEATESVSSDNAIGSAGYRRKRDSNTWHSHPDCSNWPTSDYFKREKEPSPLMGTLCDECRSLHK